MRHDDGGPPPVEAVQGLLHQGLALVVQGRGGLVQEEDLRVPDQRPRDGDPLLLAAGQLGAALPHHRVQAVRQLRDKVVSIRLPTRLHDLGLRGVLLGVLDVLPDAAVEEDGLLAHHADVVPQPAHVQLPEILRHRGREND